MKEITKFIIRNGFFPVRPKFFDELIITKNSLSYYVNPNDDYFEIDKAFDNEETDIYKLFEKDGKKNIKLYYRMAAI